jgi:hypothetical protein
MDIDMKKQEKRNFEFYFWPRGLVAVIALFVLTLVITVFSSTMNRNDLVTERYYTEGVEYQAKMEMIERSNLPENAITISYKSKQKKVYFAFPDGIDPKSVEGVIKFYRPSQARLDNEFKIKLDQTKRQSISVTNFVSGFWRVQVSWNVDDQDFYLEKSITIK